MSKPPDVQIVPPHICYRLQTQLHVLVSQIVFLIRVDDDIKMLHAKFLGLKQPIRGRESRVPQIVITATQICFEASALLNW